MDKDSGHYCYEPYPAISKTNNTNSLKRDNKKITKKTSSSSSSPNDIDECKCFGAKKSKRKQFLTGLATNLGICILLFGYTLIGSVIFLAIEGNNNNNNNNVQHQILATTSMATNMLNYKRINNNTILKNKNDEARERTVENIWDITVNLNILYRDNWTKLAALEITRFQDELLKSLAEEMAHQEPIIEENSSRNNAYDNFEWNFAKSFFYSLTVLTTIGYGSIAPKTTLGKAVTMGYAILGIPLTLLYLSSVGSILSRVARGVFSRALCCCLCSNCGYCCYDEKRMAEKERRMKKKRQQMEMQQQLALQEPFYVRSNSSFNTTTTTTTTAHNNLHSPIRDTKDPDSLSCTDNESKTSMHGWSILAPVFLCLAMMFIYICLGTFALYKLENWNLLDGFYFCFMSLTTIGFGNILPGQETNNNNNNNNNNNKNNNNSNNTNKLYDSNLTIWFCSFYIMSGMALTAMCFNVVHDEIVHRLKHEVKSIPKLNSTNFSDNDNIHDPYNLTS